MQIPQGVILIINDINVIPQKKKRGDLEGDNYENVTMDLSEV